MINRGNSKDVDWDDVKIRYCNFESLDNISKDYFVTPNCIVRKAKINRWVKNVQLLTSLINSHKTIDEIACELKTTKYVIKSLLKTYGFKIDTLTHSQIRARRAIDVDKLDQIITEHKINPKLKMMLMLLG